MSVRVVDLDSSVDNVELVELDSSVELVELDSSVELVSVSGGEGEGQVSPLGSRCLLGPRARQQSSQGHRLVTR